MKPQAKSSAKKAPVTKAKKADLRASSIKKSKVNSFRLAANHNETLLTS